MSLRNDIGENHGKPREYLLTDKTQNQWSVLVLLLKQINLFEWVLIRLHETRTTRSNI